ncbi:penicillin-binding protein 2, partial [bacterium]|nr:penicillin-binding protein 2 [bacterium]
LLPIEPKRGTIFDRNLQPLVTSRPCFNVMIIPEQLIKNPKAINLLAALLEIPSKNIWKKIKQNKSTAFLPIKIKKDISREMVAKIEERLIWMPGVYVSPDSVRQYIYNDFASHLIGYVGEINSKQLSDLKLFGYKIGDLIGKGGVEKSYDKYLQGAKGGRQVEVSASGRPERELGKKESIPGNDIVLTLDKKIQQIVEDVFADKKGAVIIMNPNNGDVLAMVSKPSYNPNIFVDGSLQAELLTILNDSKNKPIVNRSISAFYPPGSIFKLIVGLAALQEKIINKSTVYFCQGWFKIGRVFNCWWKDGHGDQTVGQALKNSCNVFFYRTGLALGVDHISDYAFKMGLGKKTGIELAYEKEGLVPTRKWKKKEFKEEWYPGETANLSIGQGFLLVTPLQLLNAVNVIINGGYLYQPRIVKQIIKPTGEKFDPSLMNVSKIDFSKENLDLIRKGMYEVVNAPDGTGKYAKLNNVHVCGKTGTVQVAGKENISGGNVPIELMNHAWFVCYAPYEKPEISMIVFIEHGGSGGRVAARAAKQILEKIFV